MRHVTLVFALICALALGVPVLDAHPQEDPVLTIPRSGPSWGPYADPNGWTPTIPRTEPSWGPYADPNG